MMADEKSAPAAGQTVTSIDNLRATLRAANFGEFMSILLQSERHRNVTLGTLARQVVPAILSDQYVLARAVPKAEGGPGTPVGIAYWASVSEEVSQRMVAGGKANLALSPEEWTSGDIVVVLDIVAAPAVAQQLTGKIRDTVGRDKRVCALARNPEGQLVLRDLK